MRKRGRVVAFSVVTALLASVILLKLAFGQFSNLLFGFALASGCNDQVVSELPSPGGKVKAVLYVRDCGATTRASTIVTILSAAQVKPQYRSPRVFEGYEYPWNAKTHKIRLEWLSDRSLRVFYTREIELTALKNWAEGVTVTYQLDDSPR
jgi:hypothetical protein